MAIQLLGFPTTLGLPRSARRHAPEALRSAGLLETLRRVGGQVEDLGDMSLPEGDRSQPWPEQVRQTVAAAGAQADLWKRAHKPGQLMLTIGGDHSTSLGTLQALTELGYDYDVIWVDAHGDFNILATSPSGNTHGMVLALACGLMPEYMQPVVAPSSLRLWGIRDLDPGERDLLRQQSVEVLSPDQVRREWDRIVMRLKPHVFLSFDMDSIEPAQAPGTMTPVPNGLGGHEALELVAHIARHRQIIAMDLVEFHPDCDQDDRTLELARAVVATALTGRTERVSSSGFAAAAD